MTCNDRIMCEMGSKRLNIVGVCVGKAVYMIGKPKLKGGVGELKRVLVKKKRVEKEGQRYTPIYATFFLKKVTQAL